MIGRHTTEKRYSDYVYQTKTCKMVKRPKKNKTEQQKMVSKTLHKTIKIE
jgi:hypothetical protein